MGDVLKSTTVRIGDNKPATSPHTYSNADISFMATCMAATTCRDMSTWD